MRTTIKRRSLIAGVCVLTASLAGCNSAGDGFVSGGLLGALGGMALGSLSGNMGKGAAAGAVIGSIGGAIIGDQNARAASYNTGYYGGGYSGGGYGGGGVVIIGGHSHHHHGHWHGHGGWCR